MLDRTDRLYRIADALESGKIKKRVTHNDPGYNNVLLDADSRRALCMLDLDTVMPGCSLFDFGDMVRMNAATVSEFDQSGNVELDLALYRASLEGYLACMGHDLTDLEKSLLAYAVWLAAMEHGMWYLTNYLSGDWNMTDFTNEKQNLYCAVNQFFLVLDMEEKEKDMEQILQEVLMSAV